MSKKKGLNVDEKRKRVLDFFYEKQDFFNMKELEKMVSKEKGVVLQTVKDIVQSLVDDGLVDTDKVGSSVFFWAFPSKATLQRKRKIDDLRDSIVSEKKKIAEYEGQIQQEKRSRTESDERTAMLEELAVAEKLAEETTQELEQYKEKDPEIINQRKKQGEEALKHANRWTDNVFSLRQYCSNKFGIGAADFNKQFGLPEDYDYC